MSERNKKYLIVILLSGACLSSIFLLLYSSNTVTKTLTSFSVADSLLRGDFEIFNIPSRQIRERTIRIDTSGTRKKYTVRVAPGFSKTQLHLEIKNTFYEYGIDLPARVTFPEKDISIHMVLDNTVFATVELQTDPNLELQRSFGSILVAFESLPTRNVLKKIDTFGEPISVVLMIQDPERASDLKDQLSATYANFAFWLQDENGTNVLSENHLSALPKLQHLQEGTPNAGVLSFLSLDDSENNTLLQSLSGTTLNYIDVSEAIILRTDMGRAAFSQELLKFSRRARRGDYPVAIVMGEEESLDWLQEELADFKKSGLQIVQPQKKRFYND